MQDCSSVDGCHLPSKHDSIKWLRAPSIHDRQIIRESSLILSAPAGNSFDTSAGESAIPLRHKTVKPPIKYWTWLHVWNFSGQRLLLWWVGFLFLIGAAFFTFVGVTEVLPFIVLDDPVGFNSLTAWLVVYPTFVGAVGFFWTASLVNVVEALNADYDHQMAFWLEQAGLGKAPRLKYFGVRFGSLYWWATIIQVMGTTAFAVASIYGIVSLGGGFEPGGPAMVWVQWFSYAFGGTCFFLAGWMFTCTVTNSWWQGYVPVKAEHRQSLAYWSMFFYGWGAIGFCMSGWFFYASLTMPFHWFALQQAVGYGLGSAFFFVSSYFTLLWVSNPEHA